MCSLGSENESNLIEKSARDGLKDNESYRTLIDVVQKVIQELELRRFLFRRSLEENKGSRFKTDDSISKLYFLNDMKRDITQNLTKHNVSNSVIREVISNIETEEAKKEKVIDDIKQQIAIYQGQATLGKIVNSILHEGRRPLNAMKNDLSFSEAWINKFKENPVEPGH